MTCVISENQLKIEGISFVFCYQFTNILAINLTRLQIANRLKLTVIMLRDKK